MLLSLLDALMEYCGLFPSNRILEGLKIIEGPNKICQCQRHATAPEASNSPHVVRILLGQAEGASEVFSRPLRGGCHFQVLARLPRV